MLISHGNAPNFDDPPKTGDYTTPEEIGPGCGKKMPILSH